MHYSSVPYHWTKRYESSPSYNVLSIVLLPHCYIESSEELQWMSPSFISFIPTRISNPKNPSVSHHWCLTVVMNQVLIIYTSHVCRRWLKVHRKYIAVIEKCKTGMKDELEPITFTSVSIGTSLKDENISVFHPTLILMIFNDHNHYYWSYHVNPDLYYWCRTVNEWIALCLLQELLLESARHWRNCKTWIVHRKWKCLMYL